MGEVFFAIPGDLATLTGGYIYARRVIEELPALGWRSTVVSLPVSFPAPSADDLRQTRITLEALPAGASVIFDGLAFGALPSAVLIGLNLRIFALVHHPLALESGLSRERAVQLRDSERAALTHAIQVVVTSPLTADTLVGDYGVARSNIIVALPGTDPAPRAMSGGGPPRLLTVATLTPRKAHDVLVRALAQITDLPWTARFVGSLDRDRVTADRVAVAIAQLNLTSRISMTGELSGADLAAEYAAASMFVLPSRHEGYGMAFAEALARGLPVVACNAGAVAATVPAEAGLLVPVDDPPALAAALRRLIEDTTLRRSMSDAAWRHGRLLPTWRVTAESIVAAVRRCGS